MVQERAFIEVPLKTPGQETEFVLSGVGLVVLRDEEVLLVYYGIVGQYLDCLVPCRMYGFIFGTGDGEQFGTRKATVMSASFEMMQPFSTAKRGNFLSSVVAFNIFLMVFLPSFFYR